MRSVQLTLIDEDGVTLAIVDVPQSDGVLELDTHTEREELTFNDRPVHKIIMEEVDRGSE